MIGRTEYCCEVGRSELCGQMTSWADPFHVAAKQNLVTWKAVKLNLVVRKAAKLDLVDL